MPQDWKSWKLQRPTLIVAVVVELAFIAVIVLTGALSHWRNGFIAVSEEPIRTIRGTPVKSKFLWSVIPAVVVALFSLLYSAIVSSASQRQPFVELAAGQQPSKRRNAKVTILLDYLSYPIFTGWAVAIKNGHPHLAVALFVQLLASIFLVPLTSNLYNAEVTTVSSGINVTSTSILDLSLLSNGASPPLLSAMDSTSAIWLHGAETSRWMTSNASLEILSIPPLSSGNLTVSTTAYGVRPQCRQVPRSEVNVQYQLNAGAGSISISFNDRNCSVTPSAWGVRPVGHVSSDTWFQPCSNYPEFQDRIGVFAAVYDNGSSNGLSSWAVTSCYPTYWNFSVVLTMAFDDRGVGKIQGVELTKPTQILNFGFRTIHSYLPLVRTEEASNNLDADSFGRVVFSYAQILNNSAQVDANSIFNATETVYTTFFAALVTNELMKPRNMPVPLLARLRTNTTRLFLFTPIAIALGILIFMMLISTVWIFIHVEITKSCLQEEPRGLLRWAMILDHSDVSEVADQFKRDHPDEKAPGEYVEKHYNVKATKCWYEDSEGVAGRIRIEMLREIGRQESKWNKMKKLFTWPKRRRKIVHANESSEIQLLQVNESTVAAK